MIKQTCLFLTPPVMAMTFSEEDDEKKTTQLPEACGKVMVEENVREFLREEAANWVKEQDASKKRPSRENKKKERESRLLETKRGSQNSSTTPYHMKNKINPKH